MPDRSVRPAADARPHRRPVSRGRLRARLWRAAGRRAPHVFGARRPATPLSVDAPAHRRTADGHAALPGTAGTPALADASPDPTKVTSPG